MSTLGVNNLGPDEPLRNAMKTGKTESVKTKEDKGELFPTQHPVLTIKDEEINPTNEKEKPIDEKIKEKKEEKLSYLGNEGADKKNPTCPFGLDKPEVEEKKPSES